MYQEEDKGEAKQKRSLQNLWPSGCGVKEKKAKSSTKEI